MPRLAAILAFPFFLALVPGALASDTISVPPISDPGILHLPAASPSIAAPNSAKISFTTLHTRRRNWLQVQIDSIGSCQNLVVDSMKVLDTLLPDTGIFQAVYLGPARRDVRVWWSLVQESQTTGCARTTASRYMAELPMPRLHVGTDSVLTSWIPREVQSVGPGARIDRGVPDLVNQAADSWSVACPFYDCWWVQCTSDDSVARAEFMSTLRQQIAKGMPVVRIGKGVGDDRTDVSLRDTALVGDLGPLSKWNAGNLAWKEDLSIRTIASWGAAAPSRWRAATGRRFYRWRNGVVCCDGCDTLCQTDSRTLGISSGGSQVEVSNDSAFRCEWSTAYDPAMAQELSSDWLVLPDSSEVRAGRLTSTFSPMMCGGRLRAWKIAGDTILAGCARVAVADLDAGVGVAPRGPRLDLRITSTAHGIMVSTGLPAGRKTTIRLLDAAGRILSSRESSVPEFVLPVDAHGFLVLEVGSAGRTVRRTIAR